MSISSSATYSSTFSNHYIICIDSYNIVYLKVPMHQGSVMSPLLVGVVIDVIPLEVRSGIPSEWLYVDDLVIMVLIMEQNGSM